MMVMLLRRVDGKKIRATIKDAGKLNLPSISDGWRFNFKKHSQKKGFVTYVLTCEETPDKIEGCLIFEMRAKVVPYMAFIEISPSNRGENRVFENAAGVLIAFASRLSFRAEEPYLGWLAFDVMEEEEKNRQELMLHYQHKYGAMLWKGTMMVISPEAGEKLINEYLK